MNKLRCCLVLLYAFLLPTLTGCGVGYNKLLFATKTNMGVDIDTTPPAAEVAIARYEGVIEPVFEGGKTIPVLASFNTNLNTVQRLLAGTSSTFAVGDAAFWMAECYTSPDKCNVNATSNDKPDVILSVPPAKRKAWFNWTEEKVDYHKAGYVAPVFFGTHSTFGLKVEWNGTAGQYPSALKLGYHRKELAWAPITIGPVANGKCAEDGVGDGTTKVCMKAPSLLATLDNSIEAGTANQTELSYLQYFATGKAATHLVQHPQVRQVLAKQILGNEEQVQAFAEINKRLANNLATKVSGLTNSAPDVRKLSNVYFLGVNKKYIEPVEDGTGNDISTVNHARDHNNIKMRFQNAAKASRKDINHTKLLNELLSVFDS